MDRILQAAAKQADAAEVFGVTSSDVTVEFENDKLKGIGNTQEAGAGLRVVRNGKIGFSDTTKLTDPTQVVNDAVQVAEFGEPATFEFAKANGLREMPGLYHASVTDVDLDTMIGMGRKMMDRVKAAIPDAMVSVSVGKAIQEVTVLNTNGVSASYKKTMFYAGAGGTIVEGDNILQWADGRIELHAFDEIEPYTQDLIDMLMIARNTVSLDGAAMDVIFTPDAMGDLLCTWEEGVDGEAIAKGTSPLKGKIGERVLDERITLIDDGTIEGMGGSAPFDDEGTPHRRVPIFENGVLRNYMVNLKYASKLGIAPTGHGQRVTMFGSGQAYNAIPRIGRTNWIMNGGDVPYADMLAGVKRGLLIEAVPDAFMGNVGNGDFAGSVYMGLMIEEGKVVGRAKDMAAAGNIYTLMSKNLVALSKEVRKPRWGTSTMLPYVHLHDVAVSGKSIRPEDLEAEAAA